MRSRTFQDIWISTDRLLPIRPVAQAISWRSLTPSLKRLIGVIQLWLDTIPPKSVALTALGFKDVHFDHVVFDDLGDSHVVRVGSQLTTHLAGRPMSGRLVSEAPNARWVHSILSQLQAVRSAQDLMYTVDHELVDGQFSNIHRLIIPLSLDRKLVDEFIVASQATPAQ